MKKTNKIIAAVLTGSMILPCGSVGAESLADADKVVVNDPMVSADKELEWQIEPTDWQKRLEALKEYEIFVGDEKGDFNPYGNITRAEVTKAVCKTFGIVPQSLTPQKFADVDSSHWAYGYINALSGAGIVSGVDENLFEPEREATYNEVIKMLVCALGYNPTAEPSGGYPNGYLRTASKIGLVKGLEDLMISVHCERRIAFTLFYNALDIPFMLKKDTGDNEEEYIIADGTGDTEYITARHNFTEDKD